MLKCQYQLAKKSRETLNVLDKHTTVNPLVSFNMSFMDSAIIGCDILLFNIKEIFMHFFRSMRKNDRIVS